MQSTAMNKKAALVAPLALSLSMAAFAEPGSDPAEGSPALTADNVPADDLKLEPGPFRPVMGFDAGYRTPKTYQVRIERRVVVRVAPRSRMPRQSLTAELQDRPRPPQMVEKKIGDCVSVADIAGVQTTRDDRLLLFLRDRRTLTAKLEKSCRARDFYSGFYVERHKDGKLCRKRDKLLSRSGANCEIDRLRQLVAEDDD